jgi:membrane-associated protease RseP (regulator of RpoE activity)
MRIRIAPTVGAILLAMLVFDRDGVLLFTLVAAFLHELGHIFAARMLKIPLRALHFGLIGARLEIASPMLSFGEEWLLAAAGPAVSLLSSALAAPLWGLTPYARVFSCASLVLGLLNLLPIRTFDGGRMTECLLHALLGERWVERVMRLLSLGFLLLLWLVAVYFLLRAGDGLSLLCFSMSLLLRFFDGEGVSLG